MSTGPSTPSPVGAPHDRPRPALDEVLQRAHVVELPMRVRFRGVTSRQVLLLEGPAGWGEFAPFPEYPDDEAVWWLRSALETAYVGLPEPLRRRVPVNATVPAVAASEVAAVLDRFPGCTTVKVKVAESGQGLADDLARVAAVLEARPGARVRVDANGAWSVEQAAESLRLLDQAVRAAECARLGANGPRALDGPGLEYAEQPCATVAELVELRRRLAADGVAVPVAADESVRRAEDPVDVVRAGGADRAVVKVAPLGGPRRLLRVAEQLGVPVTVSSALDSAVGMAVGVATAAALPSAGPEGSEPAAAGLGTGGFLLEDVVDPERAPVIVDGAIEVRPVTPDPDRLAALAAPEPVRAWWFERLRRCHALLGS